MTTPAAIARRLTASAAAKRTPSKRTSRESTCARLKAKEDREAAALAKTREKREALEKANAGKRKEAEDKLMARQKAEHETLEKRHAREKAELDKRYGCTPKPPRQRKRTSRKKPATSPSLGPSDIGNLKVTVPAYNRFGPTGKSEQRIVRQVVGQQALNEALNEADPTKAAYSKIYLAPRDDVRIAWTAVYRALGGENPPTPLLHQRMSLDSTTADVPVVVMPSSAMPTTSPPPAKGRGRKAKTDQQVLVLTPDMQPAGLRAP